MKIPKVAVGQVWYDEIFNELVLIKEIYPYVTYNILAGSIPTQTEYTFFVPDGRLEFKFITDELTEQKLLELKLRYEF